MVYPSESQVRLAEDNQPGAQLMIDRVFFEKVLSEIATEKAKWTAEGSVSAKALLNSSETISISRIIRIEDGYVVVAIYPLKGALRKTPKEERSKGGPPYDLDYFAIPYHTICRAEITRAAQGRHELGFSQA